MSCMTIFDFRFVDIDWDAVENNWAISESGDVEAIVHEMAHCVDAGLDLSQNDVGNQNEVSRIIHRVFPTIQDQDDSEVRTTAATILVMQSLDPQIDYLTKCHKTMLYNLQLNEGRSLVRVKFAMLDPCVIKISNTILQLLDSFRIQESEI